MRRVQGQRKDNVKRVGCLTFELHSAGVDIWLCILYMGWR